MSYRAKNHELKRYGLSKKPASKKIEPQSQVAEQEQLNQALILHEKTDQEINKVFKIVLPIVAFLIGVIAANMPLWSAVATFFICTVAFLSVGIYQKNILIWVAILSVYAMIDNMLTYTVLTPAALPRHLGTMLIFLAFIYFSRPFLKQWLIQSKLKQQN